MSVSWIGCGVSVTCDEPLGCYQGTIMEADGSSITLTKAFRNGFPYPKPQVTLKATDIKDIQIIDSKTLEQNQLQSTVEVTKNVKKVQKFALMESFHNNEGSIGTSQSLPSTSHMSQQSIKTQSFNGSQYNNGQFNQKQNPSYSNGFQAATQGSNNTKSKPIDIQGRPSNKMNSGGISNMGGTPNKKEKQRRRNEVCFGTPSDDPTMTQDFDFEKNLALFDKQALWEELNQAHKPDVVRQTDHLRRNPSQQKFRHDENVLGSQPVIYRAIVVPEEERGEQEYVTDDGLVIPSLRREFRMRLLRACARAGLAGPELLGRAGAEVALQLLGGSRRLHPRNTHQGPTVAFLVGPHRQGAVGVTCARHLASHGVATVVLVGGADPQGTLRPYLNLYKLTGNKLTTSTQDLPSVDLIILALSEGSDDPRAYTHLAEWTSRSRAPVLALDPPATGTPGIPAKYSLVPMLPLSYSADNGKLYLCNLAIPDMMFTGMGVQYSSPFGSKFVIALHPNDS